MRLIRPVLAAVLAASSVCTAPALTHAAPPPPVPTSPIPASPADPNKPVSDPALLAAMDHATKAHTQGGPEPRVPVEVLVAGGARGAAAVAATARQLGGTVTGSVPGAVVQVSMPVGAIGALALARGVQFVQSPHLAGHRPTPDLRRLNTIPDTGAVGDEVPATGADTWHNAGVLGQGVSVGIVDYFHTDEWNTTEQGPLPTVGNGHMFCLDTSGINPSLCIGAAIDPAQGDVHGLATTEIVHDMAPSADIYIASVGTDSDLVAAIDWFASKGVHIMTRSLGAAYDGPGDGTGPLDSVVDYAAGKGITWFNSAGNDALDEYMKVSVPTNLPANGFVNFNDKPGVPVNPDTFLRLDGPCILLDGVRWSNDWYLPANQRTDYRILVYEPKTDPSLMSDHFNPTFSTDPAKSNLQPVTVDGTSSNVIDANQLTGGALPIEGADQHWCPSNSFGSFGGISYIRIQRGSRSVGAVPDQMEIALGFGLLEVDYSDVAGSGAKPAVDSANPAMVAVGALSTPTSTTIAYYSSQGPTTDGRTKPDVAAPSCIQSSIYNSTNFPGQGINCFEGTSASSPTAAGMAALLYGQGLAVGGAALADLMRHDVTDLGAPGDDNAFGWGAIHLGAVPPTVTPPAAGQYVPLGVPVRALDTRPAPNHVGPGNPGPFEKGHIFELPVLGQNGVPGSGVSAVAVNVTSVNSSATGFVQVLPTDEATLGLTSTLNVATAGQTRPNFAIVPVGAGGRISIYLPPGGNVIVDVLGYFHPADTPTVASGRFVAINPERWMDTRSTQSGPFQVGQPSGGQIPDNGTVEVARLGGTAVPSTGVEALVVNVTATGSAPGGGFLRALPTGATGLTYSNVNYLPGAASANTAIIPITPSDTVSGLSIFASKQVDAIVDVVGYITSSDAVAGNDGLFVPITPGRAYDSRFAPDTPIFGDGETRSIKITGLSGDGQPVVPANAAAVSTNLTVALPTAGGFLTVYPTTEPATSNVNYAAGKNVAGAGLLKLGAGGSVFAKMSRSGHVIVDVNGYFTGAT